MRGLDLLHRGFVQIVLHLGSTGTRDRAGPVWTGRGRIAARAKQQDSRRNQEPPNNGS